MNVLWRGRSRWKHHDREGLPRVSGSIWERFGDAGGRRLGKSCAEPSLLRRTPVEEAINEVQVEEEHLV